MIIERKLTIPEGYDPIAQPRVASFAAQLDDELARLKKDVEGLEPRHLQWQPHPGVNTIGMLLAHLAIVDVWWMRLAPHETPQEQHDVVMREIIGIGKDDDGIPIAADGGHPQTLSAWTLGDYFRALDAARAATHQELRRWSDADLATTFHWPDRVITREWTVYHVLEHFAGHHGQILLLKHLARDAALLPAG